VSRPNSPYRQFLSRYSPTPIIARVRLFNPTGIGTWWIAAYDPDTMMAWGVADINEPEVGSFSMQELVDFRGYLGLPIERDIDYRPVSIAAVLGKGRCQHCREQPQWDESSFCEVCGLSDCVLQCPDCAGGG
jgi:hypothetical protein